MINEARITLERIDEKNFKKFKDWVIKDYAQEKVVAGNWSEDEALLKAEEEFDKLLPQGTKTPEHYLYYILNEDKIRIGHIWHDMVADEDGWIHSLLIYEKYRRRGYAYKAIEMINKILLENGCDKNGLHVFRHNKSAIELYKKSGYSELDKSDDKNVYMIKELKRSKE